MERAGLLKFRQALMSSNSLVAWKEQRMRRRGSHMKSKQKAYVISRYW